MVSFYEPVMFIGRTDQLYTSYLTTVVKINSTTSLNDDIFTFCIKCPVKRRTNKTYYLFYYIDMFL